jgi:hypothetical protein
MVVKRQIRRRAVMSEGDKLQEDEPPPLGLLGRYFHIFTEDKDTGTKTIQRQGVVRGELGNGYYLVQYFEWTLGYDDVMEIQRIENMTPGRWQFYETNEDMKHWYHTNGHRYETAPSKRGKTSTRLVSAE